MVAAVQGVLGPALLGAYLFGSAVLGGLEPASDLDVLAVTARRTTRDEKRRLVQRLLAISARMTPQGRRRAVELTVVVASEVRPWRYPPRLEFQYGDWLRRDFERGDLEPWPPAAHHDVASLLTMTLLADTPILGPPPGELLDPVPHEHLVRAIAGGVEPLLADLDWDTANVLLTLARIWSTVSTGAIRSKDTAANWALARLPEEHRPVLARARAAYLAGDYGGGWEDLRPQLRAHVAHVVAAIARLAPAVDGPGG